MPHILVARCALVRSPAEGDVEHALLRLGQLQQPRQQQRPHLLHGCAHRMAVAAEDVPERDRERGGAVAGEPDVLGALHELRPGLALDRDAGEVALDVGGEHRHAGGREALGQHLQRHRLAGAGGAGDEAVAVGELQLDAFRDEFAALAAAADQHLPVLDVVGGIAVRERGCGAIGAHRGIFPGPLRHAIQYRACTVAKHGRLST